MTTNTVEKEEAAFFEVDYERVFHKDYFYNFITENRLLIILWALTAVIDAWSTTLFMQFTGPEPELNVLTRGCAYAAGTEVGPYIAGCLKFILALPFLVLFKRGAALILFLSFGGQVYAIFENVDTYNAFLLSQHLIGAAGL